MIQQAEEIFKQHQNIFDIVFFLIKFTGALIALFISIKKIATEKTPKLKDYSISNKPTSSFDKYIQNNAANNEVSRVALKQIKCPAGYRQLLLSAALSSFLIIPTNPLEGLDIPHVTNTAILWGCIKYLIILPTTLWIFIKFTQRNDLYHDKRRILKRASEYGHSKKVLSNPDIFLNQYYSTRIKSVDKVVTISNGRDNLMGYLNPRTRYRDIKFIDNKSSSTILTEDIWKDTDKRATLRTPNGRTY